MSRLSNSLTKAELQEVHEAKMSGKVIDRARHAEQSERRGLSGRIMWLLRKSGSVANHNRHTGKPHENKREIARNLKRLASA